MSESLILLEVGKLYPIPIVDESAAGELQRLIDERSEIIAGLAILPREIKTEEHAASYAEMIGIAERWESDLEKLSLSIRSPFRQFADKIKAFSDGHQFRVINARQAPQKRLGQWEAEKIIARQNLERQAQEEADRKAREERESARIAEQKRREEERQEAERLRAIENERLAAQNASDKARLDKLAEDERQRQEEATARRQREADAEQAQIAAIAPAPITYEPPKTEGVTSGTAVEYEITDEQLLAQWCWETQRDNWVRTVEFDRRLMNVWAEHLPDTGPLPQVPGLELRRVVVTRVAKASKGRKPLNVSSTSIQL